MKHATTPIAWERRLERARVLRQQQGASAEILSFYERVLVFQGKVHRELAASRNGDAPPDWVAASPARRPEFLERFTEFLCLMREVGPQATMEAAAALNSRSRQEWQACLENAWLRAPRAHGEGEAETLLVRTFLQPYAEREALQFTNKSTTDSRICPGCGRRPGLSVLRQQGDGGKRSLICSFCLTEWEFRRILCAGCGEDDHRKLPVYLAESAFEYIRLECCDSCNQYLKAVDLTRNGLAEPVVDEIAAVALDLWARERGYSKIAANLMGF
jgi:FdhE protein